MQVEIEKVMRDIILSYVDDLDSDNIWIQDQNATIPPDSKKLFMAVGMADAFPYGNNSYSVSTDTGMKQVIETQMVENIQVDLFSRDNKARTQRAEVLQSFVTNFAQQQQEKYNFKIARIPTSFVNTSETEGTSRINRFSIVIPCHVWYRKEVAIGSTDYYDDFDTRVDDEKTVGQVNGLIEYNIKES